MTAPLNPAPFDWCAEAARLQTVLTKVASGEGLQRTRYRNGEDEREVEFGRANIGELRKILMEARSKCQMAQGGPPARHAISIGRVSPRRFDY